MASSKTAMTEVPEPCNYQDRLGVLTRYAHGSNLSFSLFLYIYTHNMYIYMHICLVYMYITSHFYHIQRILIHTYVYICVLNLDNVDYRLSAPNLS